MPWRSPMTAKEALIFEVNDGVPVREAAERCGVSRSCAQKWLARYREGGWAALEERSRRPQRSPSRVPESQVDELLKLKEQFPDCGPVKLASLLDALHGEHVMAASTAGTILARHGKVEKRGPRRRSAGPVERPPYEIAGLGDTATADYKGQFRTGDGAWCYPLTMCDPVSRYVLLVEAISSTRTEPARKAFDRTFREFGIPRQIVTDNGAPFCSTRSLGGLTQLSRWWIEMGITPVRIKPGRPDQNGIHERMHRTLKQWIRRYPQRTLRSQQRSFDEFREQFNNVRPHQSLRQKPPGTAFRPYRTYSSRSTIEYDTNMDVRSVRSNGEIKWEGTHIFLTEVLAGAKVGLLRVGEQLWAIHYGHVRIGYLDAENERAVNTKPADPSE
jgi:putative transposase